MPRLLSSLLLSALLTVAPTNASAAAQDGATRLVGTWRLVAAAQRMADGTERPDPNVGAKARGYIIYTQTGQICAMLANTERRPWGLADRPTGVEAAAIPANMVAYCGSYSVDEAGGFVVHHVELDISPNRTGTDRKRFFTVSGDRLVLRPAPPLPEGVQDWTVTWVRVH
ncbi:MAG TPA: lipocalin-like domain-containing protein [Sphingomicrobium sp.]|nr:lipocalin-like domain-containing protein [Sphingomicrobium sp.]